MTVFQVVDYWTREDPNDAGSYIYGENHFGLYTNRNAAMDHIKYLKEKFRPEGYKVCDKDDGFSYESTYQFSEESGGICCEPVEVKYVFIPPNCNAES